MKILNEKRATLYKTLIERDIFKNYRKEIAKKYMTSKSRPLGYDNYVDSAIEKIKEEDLYGENATRCIENKFEELEGLHKKVWKSINNSLSLTRN